MRGKVPGGNRYEWTRLWSATHGRRGPAADAEPVDMAERYGVSTEALLWRLKTRGLLRVPPAPPIALTSSRTDPDS